MPYVTPETLPEERDCRALLIPASSDWLAIVSGALLELTMTWNWEQVGAVTVDEAVTAMQAMIEEYYDGCSPCTLPGGYRIIRINVDGTLEELDNSGEWQEPTGDYVIPAPEAREGGTAVDRMCLATKNAVNVLEALYESLSESWAGELAVDDAVLALIAVLVAKVGFAFAPIVWALVIPLIAFFGLVYAALEYLTADLWDAEFTEKLICILRDCANDDEGVVTFDYDCVMTALQGLAIDDGFSELQARLNLQISYILGFIGGIDALNLAARTTEITNDDCSACGWTYCWLGGDGLGDWVTPTIVPDDARSAGVYNSGADSIDSTSINIFGDEWANFELSEALTITGINIDYDYINSPSSGSITFWADGVLADTFTPLPSGFGSTSWLFVPMSSSPVTLLQFRFAVLGTINITKIKIDGEGTPPASGVPCT